MKRNIKSIFAELKLNKTAYILMYAVFVLSVGLSILEAFVDTQARNWFWMLAGVFCLGEGILFYIHGLKVQANRLCFIGSIVLTALGALWFFADIVVNGALGSVGSGWWIGLIAAIVIATVAYLIPTLLKKKNK